MTEMKLIVCSACNLACTYCYEKDKMNEFMSKEIGEKAIEFFLSGSHEDNKLHLGFHGGEPLFQFELIKHLSEYFKSRTYNIDLQPCMDITTNGVLLTHEIAKYLVDNNFDISLSLDGKAKTHDMHRKMRDGRGSFSYVISAANILKKLGANFSIRMTITPENVEYLVENVQWLLESGYKKLNIVVDFFSNWDDKFDILKKAYYELKDIYLLQRTKDKIYFDIFDGKLSMYLTHRVKMFCNAGYGYYTIDTDGSIYPCTYVFGNKDFCYGNLTAGISDKKRANCVDKFYMYKKTKCNKCEIAHFCHGRHCGFLNYSTTGYLNTSTEFLCKHEKMMHSIICELIDELYLKKDSNLLRLLNILSNTPELTPSKQISKYMKI